MEVGWKESKDPVDNKSAVVWMMAAQCQTNDKLLSEPMTTQFIDAYRHQQASMA